MKHLSFTIAVLLALPNLALAVDFPTGVGGTAAGTARAGANNTPTPFSQYGQIQNVQSYSSNPYFNPNSPYNLRMPIPVYAKGTDVKTAECQQISAALVAQACAAQNNCQGKKITDIRPAVLVQLANIPGGNYAMSCAGYIDGAFNDYVKSNGGININGFPAAFPAATGGPSNIGAEYKIDNPYKIVAPEWLDEIKDRKNELERLQARNAEDTRLIATQMPKTINDLSFVERVENTRAGLEPWAESSAYQIMNIEKDEIDAARSALNSHGTIKKEQENEDPEIKDPVTEEPGNEEPETVEPKPDAQGPVYGLLITEGPWWTGPLAATGVGAVAGVVGFFTLPVTGVLATGGAVGASAGVGTGGMFLSGGWGTYDNGKYVDKPRKWTSDWHGCFQLCKGDTRPNTGNDLLTTKVIRSALQTDKRYCINDQNFNLLYEYDSMQPVYLTKDQANQIYALLPTIADDAYDGECDGHMYDADAYIVEYLFTPQNSDGTYEFEVRTASTPVRIDD